MTKISDMDYINICDKLKKVSETNIDEVLPNLNALRRGASTFDNSNNLDENISEVNVPEPFADIRPIFEKIQPYIKNILLISDAINDIDDMKYIDNLNTYLSYIEYGDTKDSYNRQFGWNAMFIANKQNIEIEEKKFLENERIKYLSFYNQIRDFFHYLVILKITKQNNILKNQLDDFYTIIKNIADYEEKAKQSIENIEGLSVAAAGHKQSKYFLESYKNYRCANFFWLLIITLLIATFLYGTLTFNQWYSNYLPIQLPSTNADMIVKYEFYLFIASKISFAFVLLIAIYFAIKNFNANKHNAILNKHRADSLLTYKAILDVAGADKQDIILTQISDCMFKHQDTGFGKPDDSGPSWEQMLNLMTKAMGKDK